MVKKTGPCSSISEDNSFVPTTEWDCSDLGTGNIRLHFVFNVVLLLGIR
jgi:hypothetical protein